MKNCILYYTVDRSRVVDIFEQMAEILIRDTYFDDGPNLDKLERTKLLELITEKTGKQHLLIIHVNIEPDNIYYDYVLDDADENSIDVEE